MTKAPYLIEVSDVVGTQHLAACIGSQLRGGEIIELSGDVGAGKTTFIKALVEAAGSTDQVSSPTFTVRNVYASPSITLYHYDFYRLDDYEIVRHELAETLEEKRVVVLMEWAQPVIDTMPEHMRLTISPVASSETGRSIEVWLPPEYGHITISA